MDPFPTTRSFQPAAGAWGEPVFVEVVEEPPQRNGFEVDLVSGVDAVMCEKRYFPWTMLRIKSVAEVGCAV